MGLYIGNTRYCPVIEKAETLPYDAEIEYIESTGTQYINTEIVPDINTCVIIRGRYNEYVATSVLCGARVGTGNTNRFFPWGCEGANQKNRFVIGNSSFYSDVNYGSTIYNLYFNDPLHNVVLNGSRLGTYSSTSFSVSSNNPLYLFGTSGYGTNLYLSKARVYFFVIIKNNAVVRDYIPVRVGQVGYMYDRVSGTLFSNAGTGSFTLGSDVT